MEVHFHASLRNVVGGRLVTFQVPPRVTVCQLLDLMVRRYADLGRELLAGDGSLRPHVHVFVDGRDAPYLEQGLDTVIPENAAVDVFPAVGGG